MLRGGLECGEGMGPELIEISTQSRKAGRVDDIYPPSAFRAVGDKTGTLEHPEVLRNGGAADWQVPSQVADGSWPFRKAREDGATRGVAQGVPRIYIVSKH